MGEEGKQLDAQREVVIATLMKLMDHHEVQLHYLRSKINAKGFGNVILYLVIVWH